MIGDGALGEGAKAAVDRPGAEVVVVEIDLEPGDLAAITGQAVVGILGAGVHGGHADTDHGEREDLLEETAVQGSQ